MGEVDGAALPRHGVRAGQDAQPAGLPHAPAGPASCRWVSSSSSAIRLCEGLAYAHDAKDGSGQPLHLVHRDLSPANVCISYAGEVKIIDFGASQSTLKEQQTSPRVVIGNLTYMSPEQARKKFVDRRADVYSAGVVLWELLAWQALPQKGEPLERWRRAAYPKWEPTGRFRDGTARSRGRGGDAGAVHRARRALPGCRGARGGAGAHQGEAGAQGGGRGRGAPHVRRVRRGEGGGGRGARGAAGARTPRERSPSRPCRRSWRRPPRSPSSTAALEAPEDFVPTEEHAPGGPHGQAARR